MNLVPEIAQSVLSHAPRHAKGVGLRESQDTFIAHTLRSEGGDASEDGTGRGTPIIPLLEVDARQGAPQGSSVGIGKSGDPMFTLGSSHEHGIAQGMAVRRLTPTECERLQGFPDGWTADQSDSVRYRQLGNAVCVPVAEWIGKRMVA